MESEGRLVYCALCLRDAVAVQSLEMGRCRHAFCSRCISFLSEYEVVTCPYDLSAMLVTQLRPNVELMRKTAQFSQLQSLRPQDWKSQAKLCCGEMRKCLNINGVPCKEAVFGRCSEEDCPYEHSPQVLSKAKETAEQLSLSALCQSTESQYEIEPAENAAPEPRSAPSTRPSSPAKQSCCQRLSYLFDCIIVAWALFLVQLMLYALVLVLYIVERVLSATKFRAVGLVETLVYAVLQCIHFPLLLVAWTATKAVLALRSVSTWARRKKTN